MNSPMNLLSLFHADGVSLHQQVVASAVGYTRPQLYLRPAGPETLSASFAKFAHPSKGSIARTSSGLWP